MSNWEKRWNPLRREWIIYAAHRNQRPWTGKATIPSEKKDAYLRDCYLCPGNDRVSGNKNPDYSDVFVFDNDVPIVAEHAPEINESDHEKLYLTKSAKGFSKVICYDPDHSKTMSELTPFQLSKVIKTWQSVTAEALSKKLAYVLVFENKGEITGVSNFHPALPGVCDGFRFQQYAYRN